MIQVIVFLLMMVKILVQFEKVVEEVVTSTENCPVDMAVDCDEVVTSTETCPVEIVVG